MYFRRENMPTMLSAMSGWIATIVVGLGWIVTLLFDIPGKIDAANKWRSYLNQRSRGTPKITSHKDKDLVHARKTKIEGEFSPKLLDNHYGPLRFWIVTKEGNRFWPQYPLELGTGKWVCPEVGLWKDDIPDAERFVQIVRVTPFVDEVFEFCVEMGNVARKWPGITLNVTQREVKVVEQIRLIRVVDANA
jgi:hypothetical protein